MTPPAKPANKQAAQAVESQQLSGKFFLQLSNKNKWQRA
jgi:hypothetical protein